MKPPDRIRPLVISVVALGLLIILLDPWPTLQDAFQAARIRRELPRARELWQSHGLAGYHIAVKGGIPLACAIDGELAVEGQHLKEVWMRESSLVSTASLKLVPQPEWQGSGCPLQDLTIEGMFTRVEQDLSSMNILGAPLQVEFDDRWGFIQTYRFGRSSRGGIFGYQISECCTWFDFSDFIPAPE